jgi:phage-related protein
MEGPVTTQEERIVLTAELRDELSAPLARTRANLVNATRAAEQAVARQSQSTQRSIAQVTGAVDASGRTTSRVGRVYQQVSGATSTAFARMRGTVVRDLGAVDRAGSTSGGRVGQGFSRGLSTAVQASGRAAGQMGRDLMSVANTAEKAGVRIGAGIQSGTATAVAAVGGVLTAVGSLAIGGGVNRLLKIEDAKAKLLGLGNAAEDVQQMMADANVAVTGTAYGLDEAATVAAMAAGSGIKPGKEMADYLTLVADAATIAGTDLAEMGDIMGDVTMAGTVTNTALNRFAIRGVGAQAMLAKALGKTTTEIETMVSKGEISAAQFYAVLNEGLGGAAQKSGETTRGALKNMRAALSRTGEALVGGFFPIFVKVFGAVTKGLNGLNKIIKPIMAGWAASFMKTAVPAVESWGAKSVEKIKWVMDAAKSLSDLLVKGDYTGLFTRTFKVEEDSRIVDFLFNVRDGFAKLKPIILPIAGGILAASSQLMKHLPIIGKFLPALNPIVAILAGLIIQSPELRAALVKVWEELYPVVLDVLDALEPLLPILADIVTQGVLFAAWLLDRISPALPGIIASIAGLWAVMKLVAFWQAAWTTASGLWVAASTGYKIAVGTQTVVTEVQNESIKRNAFSQGLYTASLVASTIATGALTVATAILNFVMSGNPIGLIIIAIALLVAGIIWAYNNVGWFKDGVDAALKWIGEAWQNLVDWWNTVLMPAIFAIGQWFVEAYQNVQKWVSDTYGMFVDFTNNTIGMFTDFFNNTVGMFVDFTNNTIGMFVDWGTRTYGMFEDFFNNTVGMFVDFFNNTVGMFEDFFRPIFEWIGMVIDEAVKTIQFIMMKITAWWAENIQPALDDLVKWFEDAWKWIEDAIRDYIQSWIDLFRRIVDWWNENIQPVLDDLVKWFQDAVRWIYEKIRDYIGMWIDAFQHIIDWWNENIQPVLDSIGKWFEDAWKWIGDRINEYIEWWIQFFRDLITWWNDNIKPVLDDIGKWFSDAFQWIGDRINEYIQWWISFFRDLLKWWNDNIQPAINDVSKWFSDTWNNITKGVDDFIKNFQKGFKEFIDWAGRTIDPWVKGFQGMFEDIGKAIQDALDALGDFMNNPLGGVQDWLGMKKDESGHALPMDQQPQGSGGMVLPERFAGGGVLGGYAPGSDTVNALLSPGESVLVPELTKAIGGAKIMRANYDASHGRKAGAGPVAAAMSGGGNSIIISDGAVQVIVTQANANAPEIGAAVRRAIDELIDDIQRRGY